MGMIMFRCPQTGREISTDWPRLRAVQRSLPPASIICIDTASFCLNPQNVVERKSHERKQHISRGVSRQQDELANDSMECPARSGATREAKGGDSRLEGVGRKTSIRSRRHGRTARQDQKKSRNAASKIQAMRWVPTWSFARTRMRLRLNSSRGIRILRSFPGNPSRSCLFSRYRAPERLRPRIELSINYP
jgi:hypothetical protein